MRNTFPVVVVLGLLFSVSDVRSADIESSSREEPQLVEDDTCLMEWSPFNPISILPDYSPWGPDYEIPAVGEYCPPGYSFDARHCYLLTPPSGTAGFIYDQNFYYTPLPGPSCEPPAWYDGANCFVAPVPSGYSPFVYKNNLYVDTNAHFIYKHSPSCPVNMPFDGANCFLGKAPSGHDARLRSGWFAFTKSFLESCSSIYPGSVALPPHLFSTYCGVKKIPCNYKAFVYDNGWYVKKNGEGEVGFNVKKNMTDSNSTARPECLDEPTPHLWMLQWSDEFNDVPDNTNCYTSNDHMQCNYKIDWTNATCTDAPTSWTAASRALWTPAQHAAFDGLVNLNKCIWQIQEGYNYWDSTEAPQISWPGWSQNAMSRFKKELIKIEGGYLKMTGSSNPHPLPYDCGRKYNNGQMDVTSVDCPYSGAMLLSPSLLPWTSGNSWTDSDPERRYTGMRAGPGPFRAVFRARVDRMGHGAWPALWFFRDQKQDLTQRDGELDVLEVQADSQGRTDQISDQNATYGMGWQTVHTYLGNDDITETVAIPITIGEWHTYAVEFDDLEIRFYVDSCLRNRLREGQLVRMDDGTLREFHVPAGQDFYFLIGNAANSPSWFPAWAQAYSGDSQAPVRPDFIPTDITVDYVRYYK